MDENKQVLKVQIIIAALSVVIIPVIGLFIQNKVSNQEIDSTYVHIAIQILSDPHTDRQLREWATQIMDKKSPVPLSENLHEELDSGSILLPIIYIPNRLGEAVSSSVKDILK